MLRWYPPIEMTWGPRLNLKEDSELPSQFLASVVDQQSALLCYFRVAATQPIDGDPSRHSSGMGPSLDNTRKLRFPRLERYK